MSCVGQKSGMDNLRNKIKEKIDRYDLLCSMYNKCTCTCINSAKLRGQKIMGEMVPASYLVTKLSLDYINCYFLSSF